MNVNIALLTVTDTRTLKTDKSGNILVDKISKANHNLIDRKICKDSKKAIKSIYNAKNRPSNDPLIVHTFNKIEAEKYGQFTRTGNILTERYWPGPLTVILQTKQNNLAKSLSQGKSTIAIRVPSHPVARDLLEQLKIPILAPSANKSGGVSPTEINHVKDDFGPEFRGKDWNLSKIIDYGSCEVGIESTIVDCRGDLPIILRHGYITSEMISDIFNLDNTSATKGCKNVMTIMNEGSFISTKL